MNFVSTLCAKDPIVQALIKITLIKNLIVGKLIKILWRWFLLRKRYLLSLGSI